MSKGSFSISAAQGRVAHEHDDRDYTPKNADYGLRDRNVCIKQTDDYQDAVNDLFRDSVIAYNDKQKRDDRKKSFDYYSEIENGKGPEKAIYEYVFQIGNRDDLGVTDNEFDYGEWENLKREGKFKTASKYVKSHLNTDPRREELKKILGDKMSQLEEKYPQFHFWTIQGHDDEPGGTMHYHVAFTPVATGYKNGMPVRNSLSKALLQMGYKTDANGYGIQKWQNDVKDMIEDAMVEAGYERQHMNNTEAHLSVSQFKLKTTNERLTEENAILEDQNEKLEQQNELLKFQVKNMDEKVKQMQKRESDLDEREKSITSRENNLQEQEVLLRSKAMDLQEKESKLAQIESEQAERQLKQDKRERALKADELQQRNVAPQSQLKHPHRGHEFDF